MAVVETQLPEHVRDVELDGVGAHTEAHSDLRVRAARAQFTEDAPLGWGEDVGVAGAATLSLRHWHRILGPTPGIYPTRSSLAGPPRPQAPPG